ncbi:MAG: MBL fold metallo-hydrolase [Ornithinimicrobium sp.]
MIVHTVQASAFGTNCYLVAPDDGSDCVIVDPGIGVADGVGDILRGHGLRPAAVLLTHGHLDHVYDVPVVVHGQGQGLADVVPSERTPLPTHIHVEDRYRLRDPAGDLDPGFVAMMESQLGSRAVWKEPEVIVDLASATASTNRRGQVWGGGVMATLKVAGLEIEVTHAPGHTEGSVTFGFSEVPELAAYLDPQDAEPPPQQTVLSGDVLFAGSIGRTDLPGGDPTAMARSLREVVLAWNDSTLVLPGHGPATTMARERASNPFLRGHLV